ncbi:2-dehydro-3-deoxygluconokinase [hydrothermal vent metagenome]|uniref:2-dehydro-3-deoxygluconokinase n=1 Tax=hydrothermal vent metagenome TaxID=652676 RepID=A0A3B0TCW1_9ZZZZ
MNKRFVSIGECMVEMSGGEDGLYRLGFAGDSFNTAWYMRAGLGNGWHVDYVTALGEDIYSAQMRDFFARNRIGTAHIQTIKNKQAGLYLIHQADGDRHFTYWRQDSAARKLADDPDALKAALDGASMIYFSSISLAIVGHNGRKNLLTAIANARRGGAKVAFDPNIRPALWPDTKTLTDSIEAACAGVDIVLPTFDDEQAAFGDNSPEETVLRYQDLGVKEVVVKNGPGMALVALDKTRISAPASPVAAIDATGAGDAFNGSYLAARLNGNDLEQSAIAAHKTAALVVQNQGALVDHKLLKT